MRTAVAAVTALFLIAGFCRAAEVRVSDPVIRPGEPVTLTVAVSNASATLSGTVTSPLGERHSLTFAPQPGGVWTATFTNTDARAFLSPDWGRYAVAVEVAGETGSPRVLEASFALEESSKTLYVVFWVDDFGAGGDLDPNFVDWYHREAGPIAYLLQKDDTRFFNLSELLSRHDFRRDYLGHHFHVFHWPGNRASLWLNNVAYARFLDFRRAVNRRAGFELIRVRHLAPALAAIAALLFLAYRRKRQAWAAVLLALCVGAVVCLVLLRANYMRVHNWERWAYEFDNRPWCLAFLEETRRDFHAHGLDFPPIVRHGWGLPPRDLMVDYMTRFGVLADASMTTGSGTNNYLSTAFGYPHRSIAWPDRPTPYYASVMGDFNRVWNGTEPDRGLLELPLLFPNAQLFDVNPQVHETLARLPHGALVSTYIHPYDQTDTLKALVGYLKAAYTDVRFVRPDAYVDLHMRHVPRPVLVERDLRAYWAYFDGVTMHPIRETDAVRVRAANGGYEVEVGTYQALPLLELHLDGAGQPALDGRALPKGPGSALRAENLSPGLYALTFKP
jgi:hypothetical protein